MFLLYLENTVRQSLSQFYMHNKKWFSTIMFVILQVTKQQMLCYLDPLYEVRRCWCCTASHFLHIYLITRFLAQIIIRKHCEFHTVQKDKWLHIFVSIVIIMKHPMKVSYHMAAIPFQTLDIHRLLFQFVQAAKYISKTIILAHIFFTTFV